MIVFAIIVKTKIYLYKGIFSFEIGGTEPLLQEE